MRQRVAEQHTTDDPGALAGSETGRGSAGASSDDLAVGNLEVVYNDVVLVLRGVSLTVRPGQIVALLGANGAGKTTLLRAITGLLPVHRGRVTKGHVALAGREVTHDDPARRVRAGLAQVMEGRRIFAELTVEENLRAGAYTNRAGLAESRDRVMDLFVDSPLLPYLEANYVWVSEGPEYGDESVPGMSELLRIQDTYAPDQEPDIYFNFGYLESKAVHQVLEAAVENGDLSHDGIIEAMNSIDEFSFDGLFGDYGWGPPDDRDPPRSSSIFEVDASKPIGLGLVQAEYEASSAADFEF